MKSEIIAVQTGFHRLLLCLAMLVVVSGRGAVLSQDMQQRPSRQASIDAYTKGDYELAGRGFNELLSVYPKDPLYKYYAGVCLIRLNREPVKAYELLSQAMQGAAVVRNIPSDALFWLGRAQQMSGRFTDAITSFRTFAAEAGKKTARELGVDEFIQQCNAGRGQIQDLNETYVKKNNEVPAPETGENISVKNTLNDTAKKEQQELPEDYDRLLTEALAFQIKADSLSKIAGEQKASLEKLAPKEKAEMKAKINDTEDLAALSQKKADLKYSEAQGLMNTRLFTEERKPADKKVAEDSILTENRKDTVTALKTGKTTVKEVKIAAADTSVHQGRSEIVRLAETEKKDTASKVSSGKEIEAGLLKSDDVFSVFQIIPEPVFKPEEKVEVEPKIPGGLIYRIQVAVFRNPVAPSYFKGITPVYGFKTAGADKTNYYAGMFRRADDAGRALTRVRQKGFKDAFVVSFFEGKIVSADRAALLEKEWGKKPFPSGLGPGHEMPADTIPPTLSFRVEVMRSLKAVKPDVAEGMKKFAGNRGLSTVTEAGGATVYLIGTFITYESAAEYADLLVRNGYRDAKVTAWLGKKQIPVDTARQLFDMP